MRNSCVKKNPSQFTIKFDENMPKERQALEFLNTIGNKKAPVIAEALSLYLASMNGFGAMGFNPMMSFPMMGGYPQTMNTGQFVAPPQQNVQPAAQMSAAPSEPEPHKEPKLVTKPKKITPLEPELDEDIEIEPKSTKVKAEPRKEETDSNAIISAILSQHNFEDDEEDDDFV